MDDITTATAEPLCVTVLGLDQGTQKYLIQNWARGAAYSDHGDIGGIQVHEIDLSLMNNEYSVLLASVTRSTVVDTKDILFGAHAIVLLYDSQNSQSTVGELSTVWLPRIRDSQNAQLTCFLVEVNRVGTRGDMEQDVLPETAHIQSLYQSLPGIQKVFAAFYTSDTDQTYSAFTERLLQGALASRHARRGIRPISDLGMRRWCMDWDCEELFKWKVDC